MSEEKKETQYNKIEATNVAKVTIEDEVELEVKPEVKRIATASKKKENIVERFVKGIIGPDGFKGIATHLVGTVIVPAVKEMSYNALESGLRMAIFKDDAPTRTGQRVNYRAISNNNARTHVRSNVVSPRPINRVEDFFFTSHADATIVLEELTKWASQYDMVSVADYYEMIGQPTQFTHNDYGWSFERIKTARIGISGSEYYIDLPPAEAI